MREALPPNIHTHEHGASAAPSWYFLTPAYVALPLIRWPLGYDIVAPGWAWGRVGGFFLFPLVGWFLYSAVTNTPQPLSAGHEWLVGYGVIAAIAATVVWSKRARGQYRAEEIHTGEAGYSCVTWWLPAVPVPVCEMLIVPLCFALIGWLIARTFSLELGAWFVATGASYLLLAKWERARIFAQNRAVGDDMIRGKVFGQRLDARDGATPEAGGQRRRPDAATLGASRARQKAEPASPARPPDAASFGRGGGIVPDMMTWVRRRRPGS